MNKGKWNNSRISLPVLAAKFAEEAGEVCGAIADSMVNWQGFTPESLAAIREEIDHARFFLDLLEERTR